ncbi:hypothetical protein Mterra_03961 [Calidithermus terrae]|uniref:Uncharacterized protein n=1 Tax=Calidithermus terrae TaxID=1408545 RepID=A0A399DW57_9DEIN|nr:hypothetical protein Mterra_03961 [Calidithermus terrae]
MLLTVREFICAHHPTSTEPHGVHVVSHVFACLPSSSPPSRLGLAAGVVGE